MDFCSIEKSISDFGLQNRIRIIAARLKKSVPIRASSQAILLDNRLFNFNPRVSSSGLAKDKEEVHNVY
jgi:hypothetical protein